MRSEPAVIIGAIEAVIIAAVGLAAYVLGWDDEFAALLIAFFGGVVALGGAVLIRGWVSPVG